MSGTDFTTTPNLGLFKPIYDHDVEMWGTHLNDNADTLDAAFGPNGGIFLPLSGGIMNGPLVTTATGGSVARSEQDRAAEVANVLDFGADPTGAADSSAAFNAAAASLDAVGQNKPVYVPAGHYRINNTINLINAQTLFGDGRGVTQLFCDGNFNMAASSVIMLNSTTQYLDAGPEIRGITITMVQNQSATLRSQMRQYPPVISCQQSCGRFKVLHCRIEGAWNGITTNGYNVVFSIWDLELGAINEGLQVGLGADGPQDFCHIHGLHFWNFGLPLAVFNDGNTIAMHVGRCDGLDCTDFSTLSGRIIFDSANSASTVAHFTNLKLDTDQAAVTVNGGNHIHIANLYSSAATSRTLPTITVNSNCIVRISNWYSHNSSTIGNIAVPAGWLAVENGHFRNNALGCNMASVSGNGILHLFNCTVFATTAGAYTQPLVSQTGTNSNLVIDNFKVQNLGVASSGTAISIGSDNVGNMLGAVNLPSGWTTSVPAGAVNTPPVFPAGLRASSVSASNIFAPDIYANAAPGNARGLLIQTNGVPLWDVITVDAESGSDAGGNISFLSHHDSTGTALGNPLKLWRAPNLVEVANLKVDGTTTLAGADFGAVFAASTTDLSKHITLYDSVAGINMFSSQMNFVAPAWVWRDISNNQRAYLTSTGLTVVGQPVTCGGLDLGNVNAASTTDDSKHIRLSDGVVGINVFSGQMNCLTSGGAFVWRTYANVQWAYMTSGAFVSMNGLGVWGSAGPGSKPTVTGAKGGNAALGSLLTALASYGLVTDSSTA